MKTLAPAVVFLVMVLATTPTLATHSERIEVFADPGLTQCTLTDTAPRTANIYVAVTSYFCGTGVRFRIADGNGFTGIWVSETSPYVTAGNSRTDLSIGFGTGLQGHFNVLTMTYQLLGTSACSTVSIAAPQGFPQPLCTDCYFDDPICIGTVALHVNCDGSFDCNPVATEPTTWGRVKALYRN